MQPYVQIRQDSTFGYGSNASTDGKNASIDGSKATNTNL